MAAPSGHAHDDCHCGGACDACALGTAPSGTMAIGAMGGFSPPPQRRGASVPKQQQRGGLNTCGSPQTPPANLRRMPVPSYGSPTPSTPDKPRGGYVPPPADKVEMKRPAPPPSYGNAVGSREPPNKANGYVPPPPARDMSGGKGGNGKSAQPRLPPPVMLMPKDGGGAQGPGPSQVTLDRKEPSQAPGPMVTVTALPGISLAPNPFAPYCGDGRIDPTSEFCRAASGQGVSDYCQSELLKYLAAPAPKPTLERWIAAQELCDQDALRRAANVAITVAAKASAGLYGASGALPNYHGNLARMFRPSGVVNPDSAEGRALAQGQLGYGILTDPGMGADTPYGGASSWTVNGQAWQAPPEPATPSVDYGALVAGIGTAAGATIGAIGTIFNQANQNRIRELEVTYGNDARAAQLALQRATMETQAEIQRLAAQNTPAANAAVQALQMQVADMSARLGAAQQSTEWTTTEKAMAGAAVIAGLGFFGWFMSKGR